MVGLSWIMLHNMRIVRSEIAVACSMDRVWRVSVGLMTEDRRVMWYIMLRNMRVRACHVWIIVSCMMGRKRNTMFVV